MTNPEKMSHWKSLAAQLGAEPSAESEPAPPPQSPQSEGSGRSPKPAPASPRPAPKPAPPRRATNWGKLANILGLAGAPEASPTAAEAREAEAREADADVSEPARGAVPGELPTTTANARESEAAALAATHWGTTEREAERVIDPLEMTSEPFIDEALDAIDVEAIEAEANSDRDAMSEPGSADRPRRRRRRGRGRGRGRRPEDSATMENRPPESLAPPESSEAELDSELQGGEVAEFQEAPSSSHEVEEERDSRRRRRRRGRGRRGRRDERAGDGDRRPRSRDETAPAPSAPPHPPEDLDDSDDDDLLQVMEPDDALDDEEGKGDDSQFSHKKIPSWQEAIESVISTNMTSRANNPSSSRGGRGRGRRDR